MRVRVSAVILVAILLVATGRLVFADRSSIDDLRSVPGERADAHVDSTVTDGDVAELGRTVERSVAYVEALFEHPFVRPPKLVLFGSTASFSTGLADLFDYSEGDVARSASSYGGIYDHATSTIAVNLQTIGADDRAATLEHELTHYMMRELTGGHPLPAWFEEGVATLVERHPANGRHWSEEDALVGRAIAASDRVPLAQLETLDGWHLAYPQIGQALYLYAESAASRVRDRVGWRGLIDIVTAVGGTMSFAEAYRAAAGEPLTELEARVARTSPPAIISRRLPSGDAQWTLYSGRALADEKVTIGGKTTYVVAFTVTSDDLGVYRGSFGSTAPPGTYVIGAAGASAEIMTGTR
jgi:hypothetical protein